MITRFILCFGWWGVLSVLVWGAAIYACVSSLRCERRQRRFYAALILAVAGYLLAMTQGTWQHTIVLDQADEIRAAEEAARKLRMLEEEQKLKEGAVKRFAEDAPGEAASSAILTADELKGRISTNGTTKTTGATAVPTEPAKPGAISVPPEPAREEPAPAVREEPGAGRGDFTSINLETEGTNMVPAYLAGGKVKRVTTNTVSRKSENLASAAEKIKGGAKKPARMLKLADYQLSKIESRVNRILAKLVLWLVFGIAIVDYLRRFNHPTDSYLPLPLAATWLTYFSYGEPLVYWPGANEGQLRLLRDDIVRRGQTFLYVGDRMTDGITPLHRIRIGQYLSFWPLRVLVWGRDGVPADAEFT
ncbi:MAG: hypothetical protein H7831_16750, partial [Magnetococcus sp. WYHC-3]